MTIIDDPGFSFMDADGHKNKNNAVTAACS
jgi:hypothetical protein